MEDENVRETCNRWHRGDRQRDRRLPVEGGKRDVTLIDTWAEHVDTMDSDGLHITAENGEFTTERQRHAPWRRQHGHRAVRRDIPGREVIRHGVGDALRDALPEADRHHRFGAERHKRRGNSADSRLLTGDSMRDYAGRRAVRTREGDSYGRPSQAVVHAWES